MSIFSHFLHYLNPPKDGYRATTWIDLLASKIPTDSQPLFLDVGANEGQSAIAIRTKFPHSKIFCFEPDVGAFAKLEKNLSRLSQAQAFPLALGNKCGVATLHQNKESVTNSLLPTSNEAAKTGFASWMETVTSIEVRVETLDSWAEQKKLKQIDVLKTDCQGFDLKVLLGARQWLATRRIQWVCVEVLLIPLYDGQAYFDEVLALMRSHNYRLHDLVEPEHDRNGRLMWANAIFESQDNS